MDSYNPPPSLKDLAKTPAERSSLNTELAEIADDVLPGLWEHDKAPEYREAVIEVFLENEGDAPREHGRHYSGDERRLLNAWTSVASDKSTSESNIRNCVLRMYEDADSEDLGAVEEFDVTTGKFLEHLKEIEARWDATQIEDSPESENER